MKRTIEILREFLSRPAVRETFRWSLPALLVGLVIRVILTVQLPYGLYHDDAGDLLVTTKRMLVEHQWYLHGKKTFLVPTVLMVLSALHLPILIVVPIIQHLMGLGLIFMTGSLVRLWFAKWRIFILPLTLIIAIHPAIFWYEHILMMEIAAIFFTVLMVIAGTLYARKQNGARLAFFCVALFLNAGARPEGKLFFGFAFFLLVLLHFRRWRSEWKPLAILAAAALATFYFCQTGQAGLLLYTSVARMTPSDLKCAPGFEPFIAPIREELVARWDRDKSFPKVKERRDISMAVTSYLKSNAPKSKTETGKDAVNDLCMKLAKETCVRNFFKLPVYFYYKFRLTSLDSTAGLLDRNWIYDRQIKAYTGNEEIVYPIAKHVTGENLNNEAVYTAFVDKHYQEIGWFNRYSDWWDSAVNRIRLPDTNRPHPTAAGHFIAVPNIPVYFLVAWAGLLVVMLRCGKLQPLHIALGFTLMAFFYTIILTANIRPRFRFVLEPFWFIYIGLLLDCIIYWITPHRAPEPVEPAKIAAA